MCPRPSSRAAAFALHRGIYGKRLGRPSARVLSGVLRETFSTGTSNMAYRGGPYAAWEYANQFAVGAHLQAAPR